MDAEKIQDVLIQMRAIGQHEEVFGDLVHDFADEIARALSQPASAGEGFVFAGWQYRECHAWDTHRPDAWSGWGECRPVMLERIRADPQFDGRIHELRQIFAAAPTPPAAAQEDGRDTLLAQVLAFLLDDAAAMGYQTLGQYRTAAAAMLTSPEARPHD
jgi:hypothetical protein